MVILFSSLRKNSYNSLLLLMPLFKYPLLFHSLCRLIRRCVTYDGEHPNARGTDIFAKLYAHVLLQWFYTALADQK